MKIGLLNTYSYNNIGNAAIYAALTHLLEGHQIYAQLNDAEKSFNTDIHSSDDLSVCDRFISVGGDIFNNAPPQLITPNFLQNLTQLNISPEDTFLFGQSIPESCKGISLTMLCNRLSNLSSVTVRDIHSFNLLKKHKVNCNLSYDTAFVLNCSEQATHYANALLADLTSKKTAVISVREFNDLYPVDNNRFIKNMVKLSNRLLKQNYQPLLLIQSDVSESETDRTVALAIKSQCPDCKIIDLFNLNHEFGNWELLQAILKVADIIVAIRYHTAVLALAADRIPFNLYYSKKGQDLSQRLGIPGCHINLFNPEKTLDDITTSGREFFNSNPIRTTVQHDFMRALNRCYMNQHVREKRNESSKKPNIT